MQWFLFLVVIVVVIIIVNNHQKKAAKQQSVKRTDAIITSSFTEAQEFCDLIHQQQVIPEISLPIQMKRGEKGYLQDQAVFFEQRSKSVSNRGGGAVRVAKGIYIGGSQGVSRSVPETREIDSGYIYFTNKRILFIGHNAVKEYPLKKIISIDTTLDGFWIASEGLQKRQFYRTSKNPLLWFVMLNIQNQIESNEEMPHIQLTRDY